MSPDSVSVALRFMYLLALYQAAGAVFFLALFGAQLAGSAAAIRRLSLRSAIAGALLGIAHQTTEAARMIGDWSGVFDRELLQLAWNSSAGAAHLVQTLGLAVVAMAHGGAGVAARGFGVAGALVAASALTLSGHTSAHESRLWLGALLAFHLSVVAFWLGALLPLYQTCALESRAVAAAVCAKFSRYATVLVPLLAVAGAMIFVLLVPNCSVLTKPYGILVAAKLALFALFLLPIAAHNKWRTTPALSQGDSGAAQRMRRAIAVEYGLIALIIGITIWLTGNYSPE